jgi:hypothetical protein
MHRSSTLLAVPLLLMGHSSAWAQGVVLCSNCTTEITSVADAAAVAANWVTQLERMTAQIQEQILIFQQLSGLTNVNAMAGVLNQANIFNQMNSFGNVPALLAGNAGAVGAGYQEYNGNLLPVGSPMPLLNATNTVFNQRANSLASIQGMSATMLANSNTILTGLMTLQHLIDGQPSAHMMLGMNSRLASYQGNINSQAYQLAQMQAFAAAQDKVFDQKIQQAAYCSDYAWSHDNPSLTGAGLALAAPTHCGAVGGVGGVPVAAVDGGGAAQAAAGTAGFDTPPPVPPAPTPAVAVVAN